MGGIKLTAMFKQQLDENNIVSLFNKHPVKSAKKVKKEVKGDDSNQESESEDDEEGPQYELSKIISSSKSEPKMNIMVESDKRRFQQVILNIQSNALKFSEEGGKVTVYYSIYN